MLPPSRASTPTPRPDASAASAASALDCLVPLTRGRRGTATEGAVTPTHRNIRPTYVGAGCGGLTALWPGDAEIAWPASGLAAAADGSPRPEARHQARPTGGLCVLCDPARRAMHGSHGAAAARTEVQFEMKVTLNLAMIARLQYHRIIAV